MDPQMEGRVNESHCEICLVKAVQKKMSDLLLQYPFVTSEEEQLVIKRYLDLLKSRSEEIILYIQIMLKVKNELAFARLDMERTMKSNDSTDQVRQSRKRVTWLEDKLQDLTDTCKKLFFDTEKQVSDTTLEISESAFSTRLKNVLHESTKESIFKSSCCCNGKEKTAEEKALVDLQHRVKKVTKHGKKQLSKKKLSEVNLPPIENRSDATKCLGEVITSDPEQSYWEKTNYQQKLNPLSLQSLKMTHDDSFFKKDEISPPSEHQWKEKPNFSSIIDHHKVALDKLVGRLENIYNSVEEPSLTVTGHSFQTVGEADKGISEKKINSQDSKKPVLPNIPADTKFSSLVTKAWGEIEENAMNDVESSSDVLNMKFVTSVPDLKQKKSRVIFPRSPGMWCQENFKDTPSLIPHLKNSMSSSVRSATTIQKNKSTARPYTKNRLGACVPKRLKALGTVMRKHLGAETPKEKAHYYLAMKIENKSVFKKAAVRVRALAKFKMFSTALGGHYEFNEVKIKRIEDLLGRCGICSENVNIAVDAAKALGQLKCQDDSVIKGLEAATFKEHGALLSYECAKSLLLLGHWKKVAMEILTTYLQHGNEKIQHDILSTITKSPNAHFIPKSSKPLKALSNALKGIISMSNNEDIAFNAATCIGHLCIYDEDAKNLLLCALKDDSYKKKADALNVLIKQLNCKDDLVVDVLLHQISHAHRWSHRTEAAELLKFIGLRRLQKYDLSKVFHVLHQLLWNHPNKEFRSKVSILLTKFGMREEACVMTLKRLEDENETVRAEAIIALATLQMKGEKELKLLLDIFDLDPSNYVRTQVIKTFVGLGWNNPRVLRVLQERQKGDDLLAQEATKALKILTSL